MRVPLDPLWVGSWLRLPPAPMVTLGILLLFTVDVGLQQNVTQKDTTKEVPYTVFQHYCVCTDRTMFNVLYLQ